jgi:hypothetical protein
MCFYCDMGHAPSWWWKNWVCWTCRVQCGQLKTPIPINQGRICYRCNKPMTNVGFKFKTPKKSNKANWKILQSTWENQYKYSCDKGKYVGPSPRVVSQRF